MFEQTIYVLLGAKYSQDGQSVEWEEKQVKQLFLTKEGKIEKVVTDDDLTVPIDEVSTFVRRATGMYDKNGQMLLSGDIIKAVFQHKQNEAKELLVPISWINGAYCIVMEEINEIVYLTQHNVMEMEKVGNIYQHGKVLEKPVDEAVFEANKE